MINADLCGELPLSKPLSGKIRAKNGHGRIMHNVHFSVNRVNAHRSFCNDMHVTHNLGMRLRTIRESKGLSQGDLAELIGKDQATVHRAETMHKSAKLETYILCAKALGVDLSDIFSDQRDDQEALLLLKYRSADEAGRRMMMALANEAARQPAGPDEEEN